MSTYLDTFFEETDQSYLVYADKDAVYADIQDDKRVSGYSVATFLYPKLGIDDVRDIKREASLHESTELPRILFIGATDIGIEAEQALLKLLEEPPTNTNILLVTQKTQLLPTILSRVVQLDYASVPTAKSKLLSMSVADRLTYIQKLTKDADDKDESRKEILTELRTLTEHFRAEAKKGSSKALSALSDLNHISIAIESRGAPLKMLLEHLAITL